MLRKSPALTLACLMLGAFAVSSVEAGEWITWHANGAFLNALLQAGFAVRYSGSREVSGNLLFDDPICQGRFYRPNYDETQNSEKLGTLTCLQPKEGKEHRVLRFALAGITLLPSGHSHEVAAGPQGSSALFDAIEKSFIRNPIQELVVRDSFREGDQGDIDFTRYQLKVGIDQSDGDVESYLICQRWRKAEPRPQGAPKDLSRQKMAEQAKAAHGIILATQCIFLTPSAWQRASEAPEPTVRPLPHAVVGPDEN